jgi:hypothetical protein
VRGVVNVREMRGHGVAIDPQERYLGPLNAIACPNRT